MKFFDSIIDSVRGQIHNDDKVQELTPAEKREARKRKQALNPWWAAGRGSKGTSLARADRRAKARDKARLNRSYRARLADQTLEAQIYADKRATVLVRQYETDNGLLPGGAAAKLYGGHIPAGGVDIFEVADGLGLIAADMAAEAEARELEGAR